MKTNKRYKKVPVNKKFFIIAAAVAALIVAGVVVGFIIHDKQPQKDVAPATADNVATASEKPTQSQTQPPTQAQTSTQAQQTEAVVSDQQQPSELTQLLALRGKSYDDLRKANCRQLVTVTAASTDAQIRFFKCIDNLWVEDKAKMCYGFVGQMGTVDEMSESISGTPKGFYSIGSAFYRNNCPDTKLDVFEITQDTYWVDDPDSKFYNQRVEGTSQMDWDSAEHMIDYDNYDYGFVVNYNMPPVYNAGSAIFFHIGTGPTAGCIAVSEDMVLQYLSVLNKEYNPHILIS